MIAVKKPEKDKTKALHYIDQSLFYLYYVKPLSRIILNRIHKTVESYPTWEKTGFKLGRSCIIRWLPLPIKWFPEETAKTAAVSVNLSTTLWWDGLLLELSKIIPHANIIRFVGNILESRRFRVYIGVQQSSSWWRASEGLLPQLLF